MAVPGVNLKGVQRNHALNWAATLIAKHPTDLDVMAGTTGLEPATSAVTGQRSNQLSYVPSAISIT